MKLSSSLFSLVGLVVSLAASVPMQAHEVVHEIVQTRATIIILSYDDGEPFVGARYEAGPVDAEKPALTGTTDRTGRVVIFGDAPGRWKLRAFSEDGHGAVLEFDRGVAASDTEPTPERVNSQASIPKWVGFVVLFGVFAALRQWVRRNKSLA